MRRFIKQSFVIGFTATQIAVFSANAEKPNKPNIVLILMDDMGYGDLSCYGATQYNTPNLDRLAAEGMRFTHFLTAQAISSASRAGLLTGCYPNRIGIHGALFPNSKVGLNPEEVTIPEMLKKSNYTTAMIGKWHLGDSKEFLPLQHGFDEYVGLPYSNDMWPVNYDGKPTNKDDKSTAFKHSMPPLALIEGNEKTRIYKTLEDQTEITTLYTKRAVKFIKQNKNNPFFLYLAHNMPHVPLAVSQKFKSKSEQGMYGDVMLEIDWSVGEVLKALEKNGLDKNTLVIFVSDNGPWISFGNHAGSSGGLREGKQTTYEGGNRVPCIMKWPKQIPEGTICNKLSSTIDILPTLANITNSPLPEKKIDGVNILSLLSGDENANPRSSFVYYWKNSIEAVTEGKFKYVFPHKGRTFANSKPGSDGFPGDYISDYKFEEALYDLRRDPGERYDVKEQNSEVVTELKKIAETWRDDLGDDLQNIKGKNNREAGFIKNKEK